MSQSRNLVNRELVSIMNQVLNMLVGYKQSRTNPGDDRNATLTQERIANIEALITNLNSRVIGVSLDISKDDAVKILNDIEDTLTTGLRDNNQLSIKYGFIHKSYEENRLSGYGIFSSWWNKTWHQSHASLALEQSIQTIQQFKLHYQPETKAHNSDNNKIASLSLSHKG